MNKEWLGKVYENNGEFFCLSLQMADFRYSETTRRLIAFLETNGEDIKIESRERIDKKITDIRLIHVESGVEVSGCITHDWIVNPMDEPRRWEKIHVAVERYGCSLLAALRNKINKST
jgi:hypothetical protein